MSYSYLISNDIGKIRLMIGDNNPSSYNFQDEEIQFFLSLYPGSYRLPAAQALEAWAAQYAGNADNEHIGDYSYAQTNVTKMLDLAEKLRADEENFPVMDWASMDFTTYGDVEGADHVDSWMPYYDGG